ncbi:hypothetical protein JCM21900_003912 [Sporobolomyces salmonicolor]
MQALSIATDAQSLAHANPAPAPLSASRTNHFAFDVLPSPSSFFHSSSAYPGSLPSPYGQYPSSFEYLPSAVEDDSLPALSSSCASSPGSVSSPSDRASSPATSLHSTPHGSPLLESAQIVLPGDAVCPHGSSERSMDGIGQYGQKYDSSDAVHAFAAAHRSVPAAVWSAAKECAAPLTSQNNNSLYADQHGQHEHPHQHHHHQQQQEVYPYPVQVPSSLVQQPSSARVQAPGYYAPAQDQAPLAPAPTPISAGSYGTPQQHQFAHPVIAYSTAPLVGSNIAYALPHPAPPAAAIETPHGTYYFVPNIVASGGAPQYALAPAAAPVAAPVVPAQQQQHQGPTHGYVQLPNGLTAGVAIAQASSAGATTRGSTQTVQVGDQKIRLPVGQGKRGSTKRASKKDQAKRFVCPHPGCGRGFARNFNMQSHHKSHLGIREFDCPHCPKKFSRRHDRARHCAAVHDSHVDRDGNVAGRVSASGSPSASEHSYAHDDELDYDVHDEDKYLVDLAG